jgi:hypothetical protein
MAMKTVLTLLNFLTNPIGGTMRHAVTVSNPYARKKHKQG